MHVLSLKRYSLLLLIALTIVSFGCSRNPPVAPAPPPAPPPPPPPAPTVTLNADRTTITSGQAVTLSYTSTNATSVTIQPGIGAVQPAASGTRMVNPTATTTFTASATGPGGTANSAAVSVTVNAPPAATPPPPPRNNPPPAAPAPTLDQLFTQNMVPILFDYDQSTIRPSEESKLTGIANWLKQNAAVRFTIEGHADERGSQEYNIALGDERAASVMRYLSNQGIAQNRMNTVSYGEERPVCRQQTEDCWQMNRRAAFVRIP